MSTSTLAGLFIFPWLDTPVGPERWSLPGPEPPQLVRVLADKIDGYDQPSFAARKIKTFWRDLVLQAGEGVQGDAEPAHNRIWLPVDDCYVHSSDLQPVEILKNPVVHEFPPDGRLAEVTVPFTDARREVNRPDQLSYRLYYGSTFWVYAAVQDELGRAWYRIDDDKWKKSYYVQAEHLHLVQALEIAPLSPEIPPEEKRVEIDLARQLVTAYEQGQPVFSAHASTGALFRDGDFRTPLGTYMASRKRPSRHMAAGDRVAPNSYDLPGVPWVTYLTESGISFHGTFWHNDFGRPRSHGCINLSTSDARWIYRWTSPNVPLNARGIARPTGTTVFVLE